MKMKSEEINKAMSNEVAGAEGPPEIGNVTVMAPIETALEATENTKRKSSWMKHLGSGMRTLRLRKHGGSEKKNETVLNNLANSCTVEPNYETQPPSATVMSSVSLPGSNTSFQQVLPPQIPLPPLPTDTPSGSTSVSVPPSPSSKTLSKIKKNKSADSSLSSKSHTSRLSLREHVSKSKAKKAEAAATAAAGLNGSVPREGSATHKSSNVPTNGTAENLDKADPGRFIGDGLSFKAKLIGILEVSGPRGDRICQEALSELKMAVKAAGEHKQKVTVHVALDGLRIRDEKTGDCLYHHQVHKISFIAQDLTDTRAFGYIFGSPDTGHRFFGIKTEKSASQVVMSMRDLFQVVFDLKKKEIEKAKQQLEMQQKFLATRAAETANRSSHKSGIAETYIDGACSIGGSPISAAAAPAETDLLNLEVELTSLQEGLDNIHSTLIDTATSHSTFNRGSTASISSDPMNPGSTSFNKYNFNNSGFTSTQQDSVLGSVGQLMRGNISAPPVPDPFGDSFDPFESTKSTGPQSVISPSGFPVDPFANVDPFAGTKFAGGIENTEFLTSDPFAFETPVGACSFTFPDSGSRIINRQISITSNSSDMSSGKASVDIGHRPVMNSTQSTAHSPLNKTEPSILGVSSSIGNWTASFDDNFASTSGDESKNTSNGLGDLFTELDPLGTGRVKPFVDRKDFFQDLKNPPKKALSELSAPQSSGTSANSNQLQENTLKPSQPEASTSPLPNSFSTNFNPTTLNDLENPAKIPPPSKVDAHLRTSSIRAQLPGSDTPPSYSPPPPPHNPPPPITTTTTTLDTPSVYFVRAPPKSAAKKSPQLLRNMTIASSSHVVPVTGQTQSPKTLPRSSLRFDKLEPLSLKMGADEIPNITPPPRPPHTLVNSLGGVGSTARFDRSSTLSTTALPRPHSGGEGKRQLTSIPTNQQQQQVGSAAVPPEPPPRPFVPSIEPVLPPPPLPPKKQTIGPILSTTLGRVNYNASHKTRTTGDAICNFNDLPLPLPLRKGSQQNGNSGGQGQQQPRYAYPLENSPTAVSTTSQSGFGFGSDKASFDETDNAKVSSVSSNIVQTKHTLPGLTMEAALNQVASLSLSQLAIKLEMPVDRLSSYTIQELAIKLTMMNLKKDEVKTRDSEREPQGHLKTLPNPMLFDSNFAYDDDFSTVSAPANVFTSDPTSMNQFTKREEVQNKSEPQYDKYAVFRELESEAASGFSVCGSQETLPLEEEEDGQRSRTLTSRGSSSEKTLQADVDAAGNGLSTMDDITDTNFSDGEDEEAKSVLIDEVVDLNLKAEWATFESNFDEQFVPLAATFSRSAESPWDSDADNNKAKFGPTEIVTEEIQQQVQKIKSPKLDPLTDQCSQFDFQLFEKPLVSVDPGGRRNSRGNELRGHVTSTEPLHFQRQSSGSSKHSEKSFGPPRPASSRNITTSDYSDSGKEKERSYRNPPDGWKGDGRRRTDSRNSGGGRRCSREESDEGSGRRKWRRQYYYDDEDGGSASPVERRRHRRRQDDDDCYSNASSSRHSHRGSGSSRHSHTGKYYSQSLHRKDREGRLGVGHSGRRPSETEKYSDHESDFDDSYEDERRRGGRGSGSGYSRSERDYRLSRPASGGGSGSGGKQHRKPRYRDSSREYYHHYHRHRRHSRDRTYHVPYHHSRKVEDEYDDGRDVSEYSEEDGSRSRRIRGRRRTDRDKERQRERDRHRYYNNSPSWESETPPSGKDEDDPDGDIGGSEITRGTRLRKSDLERPRDRDRDRSGKDRERERPSSSSYHGDRLDGNCRKASRYQSDLSLNANKPNPKLSVTEFGFEEDNFLPPSQQQKQSHPHIQEHRSNQSEPSRPSSHQLSSHSESNSNKTLHHNSSTNSSNTKIYSAPIEQKLLPAESPFADNFLAENNIFFPADFSSVTITPNNIINNSEAEETPKIINSNVITGNNIRNSSNQIQEPATGSNSSTAESPDKSDENEEPSSPEITGIIEERNNGDSRHKNHHQKDSSQIIQVVRKPIISDTIHEHPDTEMKKSDSFNIFDRNKDPFADDDFFT